jgi:hypothetical protein
VTPELAAKVVREYLLPMFGNSTDTLLKADPSKSSTLNRTSVVKQIQLTELLSQKVADLQ